VIQGIPARVFVLVAAAALYIWNAATVPPFSGYDELAHEAYILTIVREGRLPGIFEGWCTFHPPLYYLLGSLVWWALEGFGPWTVLIGLRMIGSCALLSAGWACFRVVSSLGGEPKGATVATALAVLVPCSTMEAAMVRNEALAAGRCALAVLPLLRLQRDPGDHRVAAILGALAGLALATRHSSIILLGGCAVPYLRRGWDGPRRRSLATFLLAFALFYGPVLVRNLRLAGTPFPINQSAARQYVEAGITLGRRTLGDYLRFDPRALLHPFIYEPPYLPLALNLSPVQRGVWSLAYVSAWSDPFGHRLPPPAGRPLDLMREALLFLGLVPTSILLAGLVVTAREVVRQGFAAPEAPLVSMAALGLALFIAFTWMAPTLAAVKASYLLSLLVPAAAFFARGLVFAGERWQRSLLALSATAALLAALLFTNRLTFATAPLSGQPWDPIIEAYPSSHMADALEFFEPRAR
jgi:hypothetical protein